VWLHDLIAGQALAKFQYITRRFAMEKYIRMISGVFFLVALNLCLLIFVHPAQARSNSSCQLASNTPYSQGVSAAAPSVPPGLALAAKTLSPGKLQAVASPNSGPANASNPNLSSRVKNQQMLLLLLLVASSAN
jgi:hypothetical protein